MGLSSNTTKSSQSQTNNSTTSGTTTPNVPTWAAQPTMDYFEQVKQFGNDLFKQPNLLATLPNNSLLAAANNSTRLPTGANELGQSNAFAAQAGGAKAPTIADVTQVADIGKIGVKSATAGSLLDGLEKYYNPFQEQVVDTTLSGVDLNQAKQQNAQRAAAARGAAFGGSRDAIASTELLANQDRERAGIEAGLRAQGYDAATANSLADAQMRTQTSQFNVSQANTASNLQAQIRADKAKADAAAANARSSQQAGLDAQQLDRMLSAGGLLSSNAQTGSAIANNNVATQANVGKSLWDIDQYNNASRIAGLGAYQGLLSGYEPFVGNSVNGTEYSTGTGTSTQTTPGGLFGQLLGIGGQLGSAALLKSERRVKRDIELIDREHDGLGRYRYNYIWDPADEPRRTGVMVDEVSTLRPWALGPIMDGVQTVDYSKLETR